ncbi:FAD-dependent monooxygenase [Marinicella sp. S1101]|uniref:FAD-dependent monooxygenase n=1 Tax=Marinicella marina TaxID=2996016 RepID=UPI0022609051|nr:FAD-dependent monooxygenase [Marinicella marina]MCX7553775.1 FAD-dependent monooxygenase [Marinicella marina]MDJ1140850.1 FAD-dependent monooxygenase [Marinicella marina]
MNNSYDIIINGAGMVGAFTALLLAERGIKVAVMEGRSQTTYSNKADRTLRVSAISQHNLQLLQQLGVMDLMQANRVGYYHNMQVWDNHSNGEIAFQSPSSEPLGAMIENNQTVAALQQKLTEHANATLFFATTLTSYEQSTRKVRVKLDDNEALQAALLVGADGARSRVRTATDISFTTTPYKQHGLVCYVSIENAPERTALQAFNQSGPVGLLPMNEGIFSVVWSLPETQVEQWLGCDTDKFNNALQAHINRHFGEIKLISERAAFPLSKSYASAYHEGRVVLVGDAAHTIHPLAGQGVNLGFGDAELLAEKASQINLRDFDEVSTALRQYQRARTAEAHKTAETMHALHHLFVSQSAPIKMLRAFGMNGLDQVSPIKRWLLQQAGS